MKFMEVFLGILMTLVMILVSLGGIGLSCLWPIIFFSDPTIGLLLSIVSILLWMALCVMIINAAGC